MRRIVVTLVAFAFVAVAAVACDIPAPCQNEPPEISAETPYLCTSDDKENGRGDKDAPCDPDTEVPCCYGLSCDSATSTCQPDKVDDIGPNTEWLCTGFEKKFGKSSIAGKDEACDPDRDICCSGLKCDSATKTCQLDDKVRRFGENCAESVECMLGLVCINGQCALPPTPPGLLGSYCRGSWECSFELACDLENGCMPRVGACIEE